jgi:hypothetical protein
MPRTQRCLDRSCEASPSRKRATVITTLVPTALINILTRHRHVLAHTRAPATVRCTLPVASKPCCPHDSQQLAICRHAYMDASLPMWHMQPSLARLSILRYTRGKATSHTRPKTYINAQAHRCPRLIVRVAQQCVRAYQLSAMMLCAMDAASWSSNS